MYIGLVDQDALIYTKSFFPNLEIMKLASYHKNKKDIVDFVLDMRDTNKYSKYYLVKEINDNYYPSFSILQENCCFRGAAFSGDEYSPLSEDIEKVIPDYSIYNNYKRIKKPKIVAGYTDNILSNSSFCRLYYNNEFREDLFKNSLENRISREGNIICYDKFLLTHEFLDYFEENFKYDKRKVKIINKQKSADLDLIVKTCGKKYFALRNRTFNFIIYSKAIQDSEFLKICELSKEFHLPIMLENGIDKYKTYTDNYCKEEAIRALRRAIYSVANSAKIRYYCENNSVNVFGMTVVKCIGNWVNNRLTNETFAEYANTQMSKECRQYFQNIYNSNNYIKELSNIKPSAIRKKGGIRAL